MSHSITKTHSYVYFIQDTYSKNIKIGISNNPVKRLQSLQTAHAHPLQLLKIIPGGEVRERELHQQFADARLSGEWFSPTKELLALVHGAHIVDEHTGDGGQDGDTIQDDDEPEWKVEARASLPAMLFIVSFVACMAIGRVLSMRFFPEQSLWEQAMTATGAFTVWLLFVRRFVL